MANHTRKPTNLERLLDIIDVRGKGECWSVQKPPCTSGYHQISWNGKYELVHRLMYQVFTGTKLKRGEVVGHRCRNTHCANPYHLRLGTPGDTMLQQNNGRKGQRPKRIDWTEKVLIAKDRGTMLQIARAHNVSVGTVSRVKREMRDSGIRL